jgi:hypothetical protein
MAATQGLSFTWTEPPATLIRALDGYEQQIVQAIGELANFFASKMEADAKASAPWNDQTGAARQGLRGFAVVEATRVVMYLVHSVEYGLYLELGTRNMAPRPVIMPVLERNYGEVMGRVRQLVGA